jgi:hypothetical protein
MIFQFLKKKLLTIFNKEKIVTEQKSSVSINNINNTINKNRIKRQNKKLLPSYIYPSRSILIKPGGYFPFTGRLRYKNIILFFRDRKKYTDRRRAILNKRIIVDPWKKFKLHKP